MQTKSKKIIKFTVLILSCLFVRFIPVRPPNVEPILTALMPLSKGYGSVLGFMFGFLSIVLYDLITDTGGVWTIFTATTYGLLGFFASIFFKNRKNTGIEYVKFAIIGTLAFDIITGLVIGPMIFNQSFASAFFGQIPFTALHLLGNISFAYFLSPALYNFVNQKEEKIINNNIISAFNINKAI